MDLDLLELGRTSFIGGFAVFGILLILRLFYGLRIPAWEKDTATWPWALALVVLSYGIGIVTENGADRYSEEAWFDYSGSRLKIDALFESECSWYLFWTDNRSCTYTIKRPLANEVAARLKTLIDSNSVIVNYDTEGFKSFVDFVCYVKTVTSADSEKPVIEKRVSELVLPAYYLAKNHVYQNENHFAEMREIEARSEFSRSLMFLSVLLIIFLLCVGLSKKALDWKKGRKRGKAEKDTDTSKEKEKSFGGEIEEYFNREDRIRHPLQWTFMLVIFLVAIMLISYFGYATEEMEFNKRAFGYFVNLVIFKT